MTLAAKSPSGPEASLTFPFSFSPHQSDIMNSRDDINHHCLNIWSWLRAPNCPVHVKHSEHQCDQSCIRLITVFGLELEVDVDRHVRHWHSREENVPDAIFARSAFTAIGSSIGGVREPRVTGDALVKLRTGADVARHTRI